MFQFFVHGVSLERDKMASSSYCEGNSQNDHLFIDLQLNKFSKQLKSNSWKATSKRKRVSWTSCCWQNGRHINFMYIPTVMFMAR